MTSAEENHYLLSDIIYKLLDYGISRAAPGFARPGLLSMQVQTQCSNMKYVTALYLI